MLVYVPKKRLGTKKDFVVALRFAQDFLRPRPILWMWIVGGFSAAGRVWHWLFLADVDLRLAEAACFGRAAAMVTAGVNFGGFGVE